MDAMLKSRLEGSFAEKSQRVFNKKAKSAANFVGEEKDHKLSYFDLFTSTAGNLELRNFSLFIELMLVIAPSAANVERSFSLMNIISSTIASQIHEGCTCKIQV